MSISRRHFTAALGLLFLVAPLRAQEVPTLIKAIPDFNLNGLGNTAIDLREFFGVPDLAGASLVQMRTVAGPINIRLLPTDAPLTVQNFLNYVNRGAFTNSLFHRSDKGFVLQGGGFTASVSSPTVNVTAIPADPTVQNEFKISNTRGTLGMAKIENLPNSATNQWFINLANNSFLDTQNGGFTVFARVVGTGMSVVDTIANYPTINAGSGFTQLPVRDFNGTNFTSANLLFINSVAPIPLFATESGQTAVVRFTGSVDVTNIISGTFVGPTLNLATVGQADGLVNIVLTATDSNGNTATDTFLITASHIVAAGSGTQVNFNVTHPSGNVYDQVLLTGSTATVTADNGQLTRLSFVDLNDDIVQLEFSGAGTLKVTLESPTGPNPPLNYNQAVNYIKGHAVVEIAGANETTNLLITSVGKLTAFDPTGAWDLSKPVSGTNNPLANGNAIFKSGTAYDGIADVALVTIASTNGKFGGLYCGGAGFFRASGRTGIDAPGIEFTKRVIIHDITASGTAVPVLLTGAIGTSEAAGSDFNGKINVAGGDLRQTNAQPVQIAGLEKVKFRANYNSHYVFLPALNNQALFTRSNVNVTNQVVENPTP